MVTTNVPERLSCKEDNFAQVPKFWPRFNFINNFEDEVATFSNFSFFVVHNSIILLAYSGHGPQPALYSLTTDEQSDQLNLSSLKVTTSYLANPAPAQAAHA